MKPIMFNTEMVLANLNGRKHCIRQVMQPQPILDGGFWKVDSERWSDCLKSIKPIPRFSLYNQMPCRPGDILYVQEEWRVKEAGYPPPYSTIEYKAGGTEKFNEIVAIPTAGGEWKPAIDMPEEAARLLLLVKAVRAERLQEITAEDALKECGVSERPYFMYETVGQLEAYARKRFKELWDSAIPKDKLRIYDWEANPWVWVIEFEKISKEEVKKGDGYETI